MGADMKLASTGAFVLNGVTLKRPLVPSLVDETRLKLAITGLQFRKNIYQQLWVI